MIQVIELRQLLLLDREKPWICADLRQIYAEIIIGGFICPDALLAIGIPIPLFKF